MGAAQKQGSSFLGELREFLAFLGSLWGILAAISTLFPLSNVLVEAIPLATSEDAGFLDKLPPALFTAVATLGSLFFMLLTFSERYSYPRLSAEGSIQHASLRSFLIGVGCLCGYLLLYFSLKGLIYGFENAPGGILDFLSLSGEMLSLLFYGGFFTLVTRAFFLLAMLEFYRPAPQE